MSFRDLFLQSYSGILLKNYTVILMMLVIPKMPIKFECPSCKTVYMHKYTSDAILASYPNCPHCQQPGQIQGMIEMQDVFKHPVAMATYYLHEALQRFQR